MNPADDKQCRDNLKNFWKDYLKVHFNILINSIQFSRSFSALSVTNPGTTDSIHAKFWKFCDPLDNVGDFACDHIQDGITSLEK